MGQLILYPDERLMGKSKTVALIDGDLAKIAVALNRMMSDLGAFGVAAPQIGYPVRLAVIRNPIGSGPGLVLVNPILMDSDGEEVSLEGCLSLPGISAEVPRPKTVLVESADLTGAVTVHSFKGEAARAVMHEIDHLSGKFFWDYLSDEERKALMGEYMEGREDSTA